VTGSSWNQTNIWWVW